LLKTRIIPTLLLRDNCLVKTIKFNKYNYIGDPVNTVRIFNELEVDELVFLDILASKENRSINFNILKEIANECFMPLSYGGGIKSVEDAQKIFSIGFEKIVINSSAIINPKIISNLANQFGTQSVVGSIDVKKNLFGKYGVYSHSATIRSKYEPVQWALELERLGAGELLITCVDYEGTWQGFDYKFIKTITDKVGVPVIAHGGAGNIDHIEEVIRNSNVSAVAIGSLIVFQKQGMGVLVNFPDKVELTKLL
jgi:imidazole glycerol-phosphate synthase subunit HisF